MGEEIDLDKSQSSDSYSLKPTNLFYQAPKVHGSNQESSESSNLPATLNQAFVSRTDYDKLCLSLLSGLPNEQELALNVCTILSNEGNYMLHLEQTPKLVNLLVAQTGIWPVGDDALKMLYLESWKDLKGRNMYRFWRSTLDLQNPELIQLLGLEIGDYDPLSTLLNLETDLGLHNHEGQRVLRVALILHNLSFERNNIPILIACPTFIRFVLLCVHSSYANLKQVGCDTLCNLAFTVKLTFEKDVCSRLIFRTVMDGILSYDRFMNIRSMDILAQLCGHEANEDIIPSRLDIEVYQQMVAFLTVRDIMLLFYTLEALYALSDLGRYACDKIVSVHGCIGALVSLLTLEPTEYGPSGQINMKLIKTLVPVDADAEKDSCGTVVVDETPSSPAPITTNVIEPVDSEIFAMNWLKSSYEASPGNSISRNDIYSDYLSSCTKAGRKDFVNANVFADYVKKAFPTCGVKKFESRGVITFHHDGLQKKGLVMLTGSPVTKSIASAHPLTKACTPAQVSCKSTPKPVFNSILKSQLSSGPKNISTTPLKNSQVMTNQKIQPAPLTMSPAQRAASPAQRAVSPAQRAASPATPSNSGSSTLIKSLLASKVQQRNLQQQVVPSSVSKMVIYSPGSSGGIIGPHTTVVRCIRPGSLHAVNIGTQIRTPLQTCLVSNNTRIITNASPRFIKNTVIRHAVQPQILKQNIVSSIPRINGLQKDVQLVENESIKAAIESPSTQLSLVGSEQNHITGNSDVDQHSTLSNGDNLQLTKFINPNSDLNMNINSSIIQNSMHIVSTNKEFIQSENPLVCSKSSNDNISSKEQKEPANMYENKNDSLTNISVEQPAVQSQMTLSSPTSILKSVLSDLDQSEEIKKQQQQQQQQKDILKRAPLLNGLLDKGKLPLPGNVQSNTMLLNGNETTTLDILNSKDNKPSQFVQLNQNSFVIPVSSLNTVISAPQSNLILMPVSSMNPVISSSPLTLTSGILATSPVNSTGTFISSSNSTVQLSVPNPVIPSNTFLSNGSNLMQLCIGQTTLSGTVEVQSDQQGVVRLHIESPENSNQGSDLSSISDITRTLECASKALLKTNAECNTQASFNNTCETTAVTSITTTNPTTLTRTGQQIFVVTPTLNQPPLQLQQPNFKLHILHSLPKVEEPPGDLIGFPNVSSSQPNQLPQVSSEISSISTTSLKRPSSDISSQLNVPVAKKPCGDSNKTPLADSLRLPTSVPCTFDTTNVTQKIQDTKSLLLKSSQSENSETVSKSATPKTAIKHVPKVDMPNEKGARTFSGLSSVNSNQPNIVPSQVPQKSTMELEFLCEWKNCGLKFQNPSSVFLHATKVHAPLSNNDMVCLWEGCDSVKRRRLSLLTHLQDWHCNESVLQNQALRRKQISQTGKSSIQAPQKPPPHPGYAPDAALLAIKRHALQYINPKELSEEKESALTKSIRLTSALILRNLVTHSTLARTYLRRFEPELAYLAMSPVESARTLAQCLSQLYSTHD